MNEKFLILPHGVDFAAPEDRERYEAKIAEAATGQSRRQFEPPRDETLPALLLRQAG